MSFSGIRIAVLIAALSLLSGPAGAASGVLLLAQADSGGERQGKPRLIDFWQPGDNGQRMNIRGRVTSLDGTPLAGIPISIRQANGDGEYTDDAHQGEDHHDHAAQLASPALAEAGGDPLCPGQDVSDDDHHRHSAIGRPRLCCSSPGRSWRSLDRCAEDLH